MCCLIRTPQNETKGKSKKLLRLCECHHSLTPDDKLIVEKTIATADEAINFFSICTLQRWIDMELTSIPHVQLPQMKHSFLTSIGI